ncbi:aminoacyl-tRNA hydrolase [Elioraea sp.]|uniref:aminoacyl-tRNA hydrolase n=1 Tax=Elioraea sp. TaxID=2185103 RepID=UPI003F6F2C45
MLLWVGLGNPGPEYARNRHNIGFMALDAIASRHAFAPWRHRFRGMVADGTIAGRKVLALKPQTYMNLSGESVQAAMAFFRVPLDAVTVFHDELDLAAGRVRVKKGGGNAGHNGLRSITQHCGGPDFWRVRLGIGHPGDKERVTGHVLGDFAKSDREWVETLLDRVAEAAPFLADGRDDKFMSQVAVGNGSAPPGPARSPPQGPGGAVP